jgi:phosphoenolpyruvate---glycerone phosphotransferase subunit DhaL
MNHGGLVVWLKAWADQVKTEKDYISDLDNAIGDGDHGFNMSKGLTAYLDARAVKPAETISDEFKMLGMTMLSKVGGASGPLFGSAFLSMSKDTAGKDELTLDDVITLLSNALEAIQKRGKATVGEKTMIDVWHPAIELLKNNELTMDAIDGLVNATIPMMATKGRAAYLGERSIGHIDPGSYSSGLMLKHLLSVL